MKQSQRTSSSFFSADVYVRSYKVCATCTACLSVLFIPSPQASTQRVTGPYVPMHRSLSDSSGGAVGLCDYEPMALTNTSSDSDCDEDDDAGNDMYVNFESPRMGSGKYHCTLCVMMAM